LNKKVKITIDIKIKLLYIIYMKDFVWPLFWLILIIMFYGEPDLQDALVNHLNPPEAECSQAAPVKPLIPETHLPIPDPVTDVQGPVVDKVNKHRPRLD